MVWRVVAAGLAVGLGQVLAQTPPPPSPPKPLAPLALPDARTLHPAWRLSGLPGKHAMPLTRFVPVQQDSQTVLQITTDQSYGVLAHEWKGSVPGELAWRWRLDQPLERADIATKAGDDAALKVCVMFDQPLADIPFWQRTALSLAGSATGQDLPRATLCYLWDSRYPAGTSGHNPYTARVRYLVLEGPTSTLGQWVSQRRNVAQDFQRLFGRESPTTPPVLAVAIGADSDNTAGRSLGYVADVRWLP